MNNELEIIMPVKDSMETTEQSLRAIRRAGCSVTVYNDYSTPENTARLQTLCHELDCRLVNLCDLTAHPSPNYRLVLLTARQQVLAQNKHLVIIESDVEVKQDTISRMLQQVDQHTGMVAAVTTTEDGVINFPYEYAVRFREHGTVETSKRFSFCCTLLTNSLLQTLDFESELNPEKNWYDVYISHRSIELGFTNYLMLDNPVIHRPHSSRPWKQLKYTNPLLYYWRKLTQHRDRI